MTKQEARDRMKLLRESLSNEEREKKNRAIAEYLLEFPAMRDATCFFPFVSYGTEVDTLGIIQRVFAEGRLKVAVPKVKGRDMEFYPITSVDDLKPGFRGIPEPVTEKSVNKQSLFTRQVCAAGSTNVGGLAAPAGHSMTASVIAAEGVMLLPGLAFDRAKNRVGYGGGYYDRYLARHDDGKIVTVALAYDFQIVDTILAEQFDRKPQWIITDKGVF